MNDKLIEHYENYQGSTTDDKELIALIGDKEVKIENYSNMSDEELFEMIDKQL